MRLINVIKKAITGGDWSVIYKKNGDDEWKTAKCPAGQWCADPFAFSDGIDDFIFVEQYQIEKDKGCIGYFKFVDGEPVNKGIIIENDYHMSYPDVFEYMGRIYMIPESSANDTVDLYVADHFPDQWRKVKSLISNAKYVDSTVYQDGEQYYLISYTMTDGYIVHVFALDMKQNELVPISKKHYGKNVARPGGRLFWKDGKLYRPAQDCSRKYGEALIIYQVDALNQDGQLLEHEVKRIEADAFRLADKQERIHQFTRIETCEVYDVYKEKLDLLHGVKIFLRSRRK